MPDTKLDTFEDLPEMQNEENNQLHINGFDHPYNITQKYTFLTDINRDIERNPEEFAFCEAKTPNVVFPGIPQNRPLCSPANSITFDGKPSPVRPDGVLKRHPDTPFAVAKAQSIPRTPTRCVANASLTPRYGVLTLLSTNLESNLGDNQSSDINVSICLFRKNKHRIITNIDNDDLRHQMKTNDRALELEYLSYYMDKKNDNHFVFPTFIYQLDDYRMMDDQDEDVDPFKEACIEHILNLFSMEQIKHSRKTKKDNHNAIDFGYHGMIRHEDTVYVFFNMSAIEQSFQTSPTHYETHPAVWAVVDEIVRKQSVFHIPVDQSIVDLFTKNPMLWNITHEGTSLSFPRAMYNVVPTITEKRHIDADDIDELYENVEMPDYKTATYTTTRKSKPSNIIAPILPFAHSDLFAERFLFTDKPIPSNNSISHFDNGLPKYKRFVVFIYNPKFLFSKKFKSHHKWINDYPQNFVENMDEDDDETVESYREIPCICFSQKLKHHKPIELWGVIHDDLFAEIAIT